MSYSRQGRDSWQEGVGGSCLLFENHWMIKQFTCLRKPTFSYRFQYPIGHRAFCSSPTPNNAEYNRTPQHCALVLHFTLAVPLSIQSHTGRHTRKSLSRQLVSWRVYTKGLVEGTGRGDLSHEKFTRSVLRNKSQGLVHCFRKPIRLVTHITETQQYSSE